MSGANDDEAIWVWVNIEIASPFAALKVRNDRGLVAQDPQ
jgi:hypothetical protein